MTRPLVAIYPTCMAAKDGDCDGKGCPQLGDKEPETSDRHCPRDTRCRSCGSDDGAGCHACWWRRYVRFDDVYLITLGNDHEPCPEWGPRDEACMFPSADEAHEAKRLAKEYEGNRANIVVVRVKPRQSPPSGTPVNAGSRTSEKK